MSKWSLILALLLLSGCAEVKVTPLTPEGAEAKQEEGLRYYQPKPYLLVANLPAETPTTTVEKENPPPPPSGGMRPSNPTPGGTPAQPPKASADSPADSSKTPSAPPTDLSFFGSTKQYVLKLVYLPDYSKPYSVRSKTGLIGSSQMSMQLQDGWMMTSLNASSDSKAAETISAVASLVSSLGSIAASAVAPTAGGAAKTPPKAPFAGVTELVLSPGLYEFSYDKDRVLAAAVDHNVIVVVVDSSISLLVPSWHRHRPGTTSSDLVVLGVPASAAAQ
jgi:hypothetical protein